MHSLKLAPVYRNLVQLIFFKTQLKATFTVTLTFPTGLTALSNMNVVSESMINFHYTNKWRKYYIIILYNIYNIIINYDFFILRVVGGK